MKPSSAKAKGRRLQDDIVKRLYALFPDRLRDGDVRAAIMGESGVDVPMSPSARDLIPFDIEAKNQERLNLWAALGQAEANAAEGRIPLLVFKRNRSETYATLPLDDLLDLLRALQTAHYDAHSVFWSGRQRSVVEGGP